MKIFKKFFLDYIGFIFLYIMSNFFVFLYYYLETETTTFVYPMFISIFLLIVFISVRYYKYYQFLNNLNKVIFNDLHEVVSYNHEQKQVSQLIKSLRHDKVNEQKTMKIKMKNNRQLFSHWIHNMKTPVTVIDLLIQKIKNGEQHNITEIEEENKKLLNLLEQTLHFIRLDDFETDYLLESIDLVSFIYQLINERKKEFIIKKIYPKINISNQKLNIITDVKWNKIMINQLINNALKYSVHEKNLYFDITLINNEVVLTIKDEGIGIPKYDMYRLFEPFFTGSNGRLIQNSTGIGLYMVKQICDKLNHRISVQSKVGVGTEVIITYLTKM